MEKGFGFFGVKMAETY